MSDEGQDVLILDSQGIGDTTNITSCGQTTTSNVLSKLLTGTNSSAASVPSTYILYIPGFRKIEPKPDLELRGDDVVEERETIEKEGKPMTAGRFLGINATKRGVKTCPSCFNKIGYRAKQCKHCSPSKTRTSRKSRLHTIKPLISNQSTEMVHVANNQMLPVEPDAEVVGHQRLKQTKLTQPSPCLTSGVEQPELRDPPVVSQGEQLVTLGDGHVQEQIAPQGNEEGLGGIMGQGKNQGKLDNPHVTCVEYQDMGQIANPDEKDQAKNVINEVIVSNVTEVSTSDDTVEKTNEETVDTSENQDVTDNPVFISSKLTQNNTQAIPASRFSLQDLICGLLAQNQATITGSNSEEMRANPNNSAGTATIAVQTDSMKQNADVKALGERGGVELNESCGIANQEKNNISATPENSYDANSVALFLGEMAQRNGKKRKISSLSKGADNETKLVTLMPGGAQKWNIFSGNDTKGAKFRKIQPKDIANVQEDVTVCDEEKEEVGEVKGEVQCRIMNGNATRRGVMTCTKCKKMIGCRSKICKHCKNQVTDNPSRETNPKVIKQAVQLCLPKELNIQMFSVRKCKTGPELRCFVQFESKNDKMPNKIGTCSSKYTCDYPLCITAKELGDKASDYVCEHAKICCVSTSVLKAKIPKLDPEKLVDMPFGNDVKDMVRVLHLQCSSKNIPLVQHVSCKTLAVVEQLHADLSDPLQTDIIGFAHVRFEKVKGQGCFQRQVFCSGRSCMGWNFISNDSPALLKSCSCVHYAAALWAIASDSQLLKDFKEYLDTFVLQAKIGSN